MPPKSNRDAAAAPSSDFRGDGGGVHATTSFCKAPAVASCLHLEHSSARLVTGEQKPLQIVTRVRTQTPSTYFPHRPCSSEDVKGRQRRIGNNDIL